MTEPSPVSMSILIEEYMKSLNVKERQGYDIASSHLGMTYQVEKSLGFLAWKQKYLSDK